MAIHSVVHRAIETAENLDANQIALLRASPAFVFSEEATTILLSEQADRSIRTMGELGLLHLPYPSMVVQLPYSGHHNSCIALVSETKDERFYVLPMGVNRDRVYNPVRNGFIATVLPDRGNGTEVVWEGNGDYLHSPGTDNLLIAVLRISILMIHLQGLDREVIPAADRLNKKRESRGREPIRSYSYVHVGRVYDRSGQAHERTGSGRTMPIHMRAGHIRNQRYGVGRTESRKIWIPPVIVNYHGEDQPAVERRVVL